MNFDHRNATSSKHTAICPLCHATELEIKYVGINDRLGYVKGEFDFFQCTHCKSVSLLPFPKEEEVGSFYPESFMVSEPTSDRSLPGSLRSIEWKILFIPIYRAGAKAVLEMTRINSGRLLEIGCSSGYQLQEFIKQGDFEVLGLDIDIYAVEHARGVLGLNVLSTTLSEASFPPESFDIVILFNVLEHLVKPFDMLEGIRRILKPGGYVAIKTHFLDSLQSRIFKQRWEVLHEAPRHVLIPSREGIMQLLKRAHLRFVSCKCAHVMENSVSIALSILPNATSQIAFASNDVFRAYFYRLAGLVIGVAAIPFAFVERILGRSGTMIYIAQKDNEKDVVGSGRLRRASE